ncbi:MAG: hypothetical protein HBSAPP02_23170 [Phycisphaerae bacterium]|nr:MAG: hypothetical protein HBSAPP02_23170 [Phycisphaerae bacterium]
MTRDIAASPFTYRSGSGMLHRFGEGTDVLASIFLIFKFLAAFSFVCAANLVSVPPTLAGIAFAWTTTILILTLLLWIVGLQQVAGVLHVAKMPLLFWTLGGLLVSMIERLMRLANLGPLLLDRLLIYPTRLLFSLSVLALLLSTTRLSTVARTRLLPRAPREFFAVFLTALPIAIERIIAAYQSLRSRGVDVLALRFDRVQGRVGTAREGGTQRPRLSWPRIDFLVIILAACVHEMLYRVGIGILLGTKLRDNALSLAEIKEK